MVTIVKFVLFFWGLLTHNAHIYQYQVNFGLLEETYITYTVVHWE